MSALSHKVDFAIIFSVKHANPNGDPLNGNRPRTDYDGFGEITDVCLKRKIRDRLQTEGHPIFVQSDEKKTDGLPSLKARADSDTVGLGKDAFNPKKTAKIKLRRWPVLNGWMSAPSVKSSHSARKPMQPVFPLPLEAR